MMMTIVVAFIYQQISNQGGFLKLFYNFITLAGHLKPYINMLSLQILHQKCFQLSLKLEN